jgi:hypothetical protein
MDTAIVVYTRDLRRWWSCRNHKPRSVRNENLWTERTSVPPGFRLCCYQGARGISTVSMMYTVALAVWTLPHTTWAPLTV